MKSLNYLSLLLTAALATSAMNAQTANIYKVVDEKTGQVTYTDRPEAYQQNADKQIIDTHIPTVSPMRANSAPANPSPVNSANSSPPTPSTPSTNIPANNSSTLSVQNSAPPSLTILPASTASTYRFNMATPESEMAYRRPAQNIDVSLSISPTLKAGDRVAIYLDKVQVAEGLTASIGTVDILPGPHQISANVKNIKGDTIASVERTIYILQNTQALQQKKKLAEQLQAYQRLPWHQKMYLRMKQHKVPTSAVIPPKPVDGNQDKVDIKDAALK